MVEYAYKENGVMKLKPVALSLSQSEIDEIATELLEAMQPDWQNAIAITAAQINAGYTAPENGMIVGYLICADTSPGYHSVTVNGVVISNAYYSNSASDYSFSSIDVVVKKGDVFKSTNIRNSISCSFVPFKTMNPVSLRPLDPHKIDTAILNHWDDITSDFSTAGSAAGFVLDRAIYNPILRKLRVNFHITNSFAALTNKHFILTYNGSVLPAFTTNCMYSSCMLSSASSSAGFEDSYAITPNKFDINIYNRNNNTTWAGGTSFTTQIEF